MPRRSLARLTRIERAVDEGSVPSIPADLDDAAVAGGEAVAGELG